MILMVFAGPKRPLGCGSTSIFGTARHQLQQDLVSSRVAQFLLESPILVLATLRRVLATLRHVLATLAACSLRKARLFGRSTAQLQRCSGQQHPCNATA
jgi:hypothetical protein